MADEIWQINNGEKMYFEIKCDCKNPACCANAQIRRGYVQIHHPDGTSEERWDWFHIFASDWDDDAQKSEHVEIMASPEQARELMWFMIKEYMPIFSDAIRRYFRARNRVFGRFLDVKSAIEDFDVLEIKKLRL